MSRKRPLLYGFLIALGIPILWPIGMAVRSPLAVTSAANHSEQLLTQAIDIAHRLDSDFQKHQAFFYILERRIQHQSVHPVLPLFQKLLAIETSRPETVGSLIKLAESANAAGMDTLSVKMFEKLAHASDKPNFPWYRQVMLPQVLEGLLNIKQPETVLEILDQLDINLSNNSLSPEINIQLAQQLIHRGKFKAAWTILNTAASGVEQSPQLISTLTEAETLKQRGEIQRALALLLPVLQTHWSLESSLNNLLTEQDGSEFASRFEQLTQTYAKEQIAVLIQQKQKTALDQANLAILLRLLESLFILGHMDQAHQLTHQIVTLPRPERTETVYDDTLGWRDDEILMLVRLQAEYDSIRKAQESITLIDSKLVQADALNSLAQKVKTQDGTRANTFVQGALQRVNAASDLDEPIRQQSTMSNSTCRIPKSERLGAIVGTLSQFNQLDQALELALTLGGCSSGSQDVFEPYLANAFGQIINPITNKEDLYSVWTVAWSLSPTFPDGNQRSRHIYEREKAAIYFSVAAKAIELRERSLAIEVSQKLVQEIPFVPHPYSSEEAGYKHTYVSKLLKKFVAIGDLETPAQLAQLIKQPERPMAQLKVASLFAQHHLQKGNETEATQILSVALRHSPLLNLLDQKHNQSFKELKQQLVQPQNIKQTIATINQFQLVNLPQAKVIATLFLASPQPENLDSIILMIQKLPLQKRDVLKPIEQIIPQLETAAQGQTIRRWIQQLFKTERKKTDPDQYFLEALSNLKIQLGYRQAVLGDRQSGLNLVLSNSPSLEQVKAIADIADLAYKND